MEDLLNFLGNNNDYLDELMTDFEAHRKLCLDHYEAMGHKSYTQGDNLLFHSQSLAEEEKKSIDELIKAAYPLLWNEYLLRYSEDDVKE